MLRAIFSGHYLNETLMTALVSGAVTYIAVEKIKLIYRTMEERRTESPLIKWQNALTKSGGGEGSQVTGK
ncbi:hypothetical protein B9Z19DRAFT_1130379 [Tuber borchii]|uniref:Uncharacterized protein n=1 Tax=Tuber borchii TaxID=42251 RepID=A0A2T6ZKN5_TUBBO|nr:hypothetical protein B9Z19DRAFT_1130379 [Tuber borchii]